MHCTVNGANGESRAQPHTAPTKNTLMSLYDRRGCFESFMKIWTGELEACNYFRLSKRLKNVKIPHKEPYGQYHNFPGFDSTWVTPQNNLQYAKSNQIPLTGRFIFHQIWSVMLYQLQRGLWSTFLFPEEQSRHQSYFTPTSSTEHHREVHAKHKGQSYNYKLLHRNSICADHHELFQWKQRSILSLNKWSHVVFTCMTLQKSKAP